MRAEGRIPAVVYGGGKSTPISISTAEFEKLIRDPKVMRQMIRLSIDNGSSEQKTVMIKELQRDPLTQAILHVDFAEIQMDKKITVTLPVVPVGISKGVERGGMLQTIRHELEVSCLPGNLPEQITVDVTDLDIGDAIHVEDLELGEGVEIPHDTNYTIVTVVGKMKEEEPAAVEEEIEGEETETPENEEGGE